MVQAIANYAFQIVLGMPLIAWGGLLTLLCLFATAYIGYRVHNGLLDFKYHKIAVIVTITIALIHGIVAFLSFI